MRVRQPKVPSPKLPSPKPAEAGLSLKLPNLPKVELPRLPFIPKDGLMPDLANLAKDWASDRLFEKLRPDGSAAKLKGPQRVAYGPLEKAPTLKRPVVMIPGLTMPAASFDRLANRLAENPKNGPVAVYVAAEDKFRLGDKNGPEMTPAQVRGAQIFEVEYQDPWAAPTKKAPQLERAFARISAATGKGDLDVITHSAGGTDFRLYLDRRNAQQGPRIQRAMMIGPASHGTYMGNLGRVAGHPVKNVDDAARELAVGSKLVNDLNASWARQKNQLAGGVTIVGTTGTPTLGPSEGLFEDGDGYMPTRDLAMPGARLELLEGPHNTPLAHLWQVQYSGVVNAGLRFLGE